MVAVVWMLYAADPKQSDPPVVEYAVSSVHAPDPVNVLVPPEVDELIAETRTELFTLGRTDPVVSDVTDA